MTFALSQNPLQGHIRSALTLRKQAGIHKDHGSTEQKILCTLCTQTQTWEGIKKSFPCTSGDKQKTASEGCVMHSRGALTGMEWV